MSCQSGTPYTVQTGDTLYKIAQQKLGDGNRWSEIMNTNGTRFTEAEAGNLQAGQVICLPGGGSPPPPPPPPGGGGFANIVSRQIFEGMFPNRNPLYTYDSLVAAAQKYPQFCNEGSPEQCKREAAAFFANVAHETAGLFYVEEINKSVYCEASNTTYPCAPNKSYFGRGPIQLSWNYNYGAAGQALGLDLLNNPDLVATDGAISFQTALWFWMTPQQPKPSCHAVMTGGWTPSSEDSNLGRAPGFGMTINIINGGLECGIQSEKASKRVSYYQSFTQMLGVDMGESFSCDRMAHY